MRVHRGEIPIATISVSLSLCLSPLIWQLAYPFNYGIISILAACFLFEWKFIQTPAPQAAPRVEPEFPLSLWIRVRRGMLARMVTVSGHRGPGSLKPLRPSSCKAPFKLLKPAVGAAGPVAVAVGT